MKKGLKITRWVLMAIVLVLLAGVVAIQSPKVQTALGRRAVAMLQGRLDGDIIFGEVSVRPFDAVVLKDVVILDRHPFEEEGLPRQDTLLRAGDLSARFSLKGIIRSNTLSVTRLNLEHAAFNLVIEPRSDRPGSQTNLQRVFQLTSDPDKPKKESTFSLDARKVDIKDLTFRMVNIAARRNQIAQGRPDPPPEVINWNDLEVRTSLRAHDISFRKGIVSGTMDHMELDEKSGFQVSHLSGKAKVGGSKVLLDELTILETDSRLYLDRLQLLGGLDLYKDFLDRVRIEAGILRPSSFSMRTVSHFAPNLDRFQFIADLQGQVSGYVNDFTVKGLSFQEHGSGVEGRADGSMIGLPDIANALLDFQIQGLQFDLDGLETFIQGWAPQVRLDLGRFASGSDFRFDGSAKGPFQRLRVNGDIDSDIGQAVADVTLRNILDKRHPIIIGGTVRTVDLDVGRIIGTDAVHQLTLDTGIEATLAPGDLQVRIDSLDIHRLNALDYDYTGIAAVGTYSDKAFDGRIIASDPNLNFMFQGLFNLSPQTRNAAYQFYANLGYADLEALHLDKRGRSKVSFQTSANFIRTDGRDLLGEITVEGLTLENDAGRHDIGAISVNSHANDDIHRIRFHSRFADGTFVGNKSIFSLVGDLKHLVVERELPALVTRPGAAWEGTPYEVNFTVHDARQLLSFVAPGVYIENHTTLKLKVQEDGTVQGSARSGRLAYGGKYLKDFQLAFNNQGDALHADITSSALKVSGIELLNNSCTLFADDNHIGIGYNYDNETEAANRGEIFLSGELSRHAGSLGLTAQALPSNIYYNGNGWSLHSDEVTLKDGNIQVEGFKLTSDEQTVLVSGGFSPRRKDTLSVRMEKFDISLLNSLLVGGRLDLQGRATGRALVVSPSRPSIGLLAGITCDSTLIAGHRAGQVRMASLWNEEKRRFDFYLRNNLDEVRNFDVSGYLMPTTKEISARATLQRVDIGYARPFLDGIFSDFGGYLDGTIRAAGTLDKLHLSSEGTELVDGLLEVAFTQVPYSVSGPVQIDDRGLTFTDVRIRDRSDGRGTVTGGIRFGGFKDFRMDTHINFERMQALGIKSDAGQPIHGNVYASGNVDITGPFNALVLSVDAMTTKDGDLHIPISTSASAGTRNLLTFTEPPVETEIDPYELLMNTHTSTAKGASDIDIRLRIHATPAVTANIDIGEGNTLNGLGSGTLDIETRPSQNLFTINGDYTLTSGNFHFSALGLVSRDFALQDGSSIRFNGDIMDSDLNVDGLYVTKTSLSNLLSDSTSVSRRTVECGINITDKLRNPTVKLSINVPDLDPATQAQVESALNTEDKIQKQFLYLLITGGFLPDDDSGITTGGSNMLLSNVTSIMAGQLNSILQKLDIPLDLGLNYQQNDRGTDLFDVALSTQLFNNRVIVNGTIGNRKLYGTSASNDEVSGDLDIEIKLDKPGTFRLNLFSHSADQYTNYLDNSQRNGVGLAYQREFRTFRGLLRDLFSSKRKREERALENVLNPTEKVTLQVDSTGKAALQRDE